MRPFEKWGQKETSLGLKTLTDGPRPTLSYYTFVCETGQVLGLAPASNSAHL